MKTDTPTIIKALRILSQEIQSPDGIANAAIEEAAQRLEELTKWRPASEATDHKLVFAAYPGVYSHWFGHISSGRFYPASQFGSEPFNYFVEVTLPEAPGEGGAK